MSFEGHARAIQTDIARLTKTVESGFKSMREEIDAVRESMTKGFAEVRREMATKAELRELRDDVQRMNDIMVSKADLSEALRRELDRAPYARESDVRDLQTRMMRIEGVLNLKGKHRAA